MDKNYKMKKTFFFNIGIKYKNIYKKKYLNIFIIFPFFLSYI